jgi:hypothetical protein
VTGSLGGIRQELAGVAEQLNDAYGHAATARARLADALAVLTELGRDHSESLVPPELRKAGGELERSLGLISSGAAAVADIDARL